MAASADPQLPRSLSWRSLAFWVLRILESAGEQAHLDSIYGKVGIWLRIREDLMNLEYRSNQSATGSVIRHRVQWALTGLKEIGFVSNRQPGSGVWSITAQGNEFLQPLRDDPDATPLGGRPANSVTFVEMTPLERSLQEELIRRLSRGGRSGGSSPPSGSPTLPPDWPSGPISSGGRNRGPSN